MIAISFFLLTFFLPSAYSQESRNAEDAQIKNVLTLNEPSVILPYEFAEYSLDPLGASITKNLWIMRLLYETPIRSDKNGFMVSEIIERFNFNHVRNEIVFTLKKGVKYSDGSEMTIDDIALAIKRMLYSRPNYPTINKICGLQSWLKLTYPLESLPSGMRIEDNTLTIKLSERVEQPFQWFTIEIFSIIPQKCINLRTNKLTCAVPPFSGEYELVESDKNLLLFKKRRADPKLADKIRFIHISPVRIIKFMEYFADNHVIITDEINIPPDHRNIIKNKFRPNAIPEIRVMALNMNKRVPPFNSKRVRQFFAREYRRTLKEIFGHADGGLFTRIMSGYIPLEDLNSKITPFSIEEEKEILNILRSHPPVWVKRNYVTDHDPFQFYMLATLKRLQIPKTSPLEFNSLQEEISSWSKGEYNICRVYTGLGGSLDPTDDLRMLFSKNMYHFLEDVYNDNILQNYIANIKHTSLHEIDIQNLKNLNFYLFEESAFAVVINYSIAQYTLKNSPLKIVNDWTSNVAHYFIK